MRKTILLAAFLTLAAISAPVYAQWKGALGSTWNNPVSSLSNIQMWNNINGMTSRITMLRSSLRKYGCTDAQLRPLNETELMLALSRKTCGASAGTANSAPKTARGSGSTAAAATPAAKQTVSPISFTPVGGRPTLAQIVAGLSQDKNEQRTLNALLSNAIDQFEAAERVKGSEHDLASAMSFFASIAIYLQDPRTEINSNGGNALTLALREALGPKASSISDRDKQQFYEAILSFGMLFALSSKGADAATLAQLKQNSAEISMKLIGLDVSKYRFTPDGLAVIN
jgi:uncharacterized protein DUF6683